MRRQLFLILSLGLNICLLILLVALPGRIRSATSPTATNALPGTNVIRTQVVVRKQFFTWDELESQDYHSYVSNLVSILCPPQTVRDIIVADVSQTYMLRRLTEIKDPMEKWWLSRPDTNILAENTRQRLQLEIERRQLLEVLIGTNWDASSPPPQFEVCLTGRILGDISAEAQKQILEILERAAQRRGSYELSLGQDATEDGRLSGYRYLASRTRAELKAVLTPSQFEEYLLRYSEYANELRHDFQDVELTQSEFQRVFDSVFALREKASVAKEDQPDYAANIAGIENQIYQSIRVVVGQKRFQAYRARIDPIYRNALYIAGDSAGSQKVVQSLYESLQNLEVATQAVVASTNLSLREKEARLLALQLQQQSDRDKILGNFTAPTEPASPPLPPSADFIQDHRYSPGETVDQIAARYGIRPADILKANPNLDFNSLRRSSIIHIPPPQ
jgi:LysM repeat protein